jgi:uncharacterized membrane protein YkoI
VPVAKHFIAAVILGMLVVGRSYAEPATLVSFAHNEAARDAERLNAADAARVSLTDAISVVEHESGGRVLSIALGLRRGQPVYHVRLLTGDVVSTATVDAVSGLARLTDHAMRADHGAADIRREVAAARRSSITLRAAVEIAVRRIGGQPVEAWLVDVAGQPAYNVLTVAGGQVQRVAIGAESTAAAPPR